MRSFDDFIHVACPYVNIMTDMYDCVSRSGVARGGAGGANAPSGRNSAPLLPPQMKLHFVQRSMESRHFESKSAPPAHPSAPLAAPSF